MLLVEAFRDEAYAEQMLCKHGDPYFMLIPASSPGLL